MEIGIVGLGKMGGNMAERLLQRGHRVVGSDLAEPARERIRGLGGMGVGTVTDLVNSLNQSPKVVWSMVGAGKVTDSVISEAAAAMSPGDIIIDGGNSKYTESVRHYNELKEKGIRFMDAGTSGGIWGLKEGYCLMVGADDETFRAVEPLLLSLAPENGLLHAGPAGSVAAPTAGLHFTPEVLAAIRARGVTISQVTLHVGAGTFLPVKVKNVADHKMHAERFFVGPETVAAVNASRQAGHRVFAAGTTATRALEACAQKASAI